MRKFYHATHSKNVDRILREGLTPPVGRITSGSREQPRIYLYKDISDAELYFPGLYELGSLPNRIPYTIFEVRLPNSFETYGDIEYSGSVFVTKSILPKHLKLVSSHSEDYSDFSGIDWDKR